MVERDAQSAPASSASLWSNEPNALLSMRRAKEVGDLLTVLVEMDDRASLQSSLARSRDASENFNVDALFGLTEWADRILPGDASLSPGADLERGSELSGKGAVSRAERIAFRLACRVIAVEPNGNLVIEGHQETRVSGEVRYLKVSGVIRAQDVTRMNTVVYDKIAEASIAYVSVGEATGPASRGLIPRVLSSVNPF
jgi:flagellar L-ring protein precursor FlgH